MWSVRWFTVEQAKQRMEELPDDAIDRIILGEVVAPFTTMAERYVCMMSIVYREGDYHETIVSLIPITQRLVDAPRIGELIDEPPMALPLVGNREAYRQLQGLTGVAIDDLLGSVFLGHGPLTRAAGEGIRASTAFRQRYQDHGER